MTEGALNAMAQLNKANLDHAFERLNQALRDSRMDVVMFYSIDGEGFAYNLDRPDIVINPNPEVLVALGDIYDNSKVELWFKTDELGHEFMTKNKELIQYLLNLNAVQIFSQPNFMAFLQKEMKRFSFEIVH